MRFLLCVISLAFAPFALAASDITFSADFYQRDLSADTVKGKGNAWVKRDDKQLWADEIEVDFKTKIVIAIGHVHIREGAVDIWAERSTYYLSEEKGTMEEVTLVHGQMVLTGAVVRKLSKQTFEVEQGTYSNCNVKLENTAEIGKCDLDWKVFGRHFTITTESYAQFTDALVYVRNLPILYTPYFIIPVKSKRQSGFLLPNFAGSANLGSGSGFPFFWNISPWQDLTFTPTYYSKTGFHGALDYRYVYSPESQGRVQLFWTQRVFSSDVNNPANNDPNAKRFLGLLGEGAVSAENRFSFGQRGQSRQRIQLVSDPYFTQDYSGDLGVSAYAAYLRSQISASVPSDHWLATALIRHHQSLVISKDTDVDRGAVVQLPTVGLSRASSPLMDKYLSWEFDAAASHFFRSPSFDQVPSSVANSGSNLDKNPVYDSNDYIRTGRRVRLEPRLIAHVPMPPGFQLQPVLTAGSLLYHFDLPVSDFVHREYVQMEIPFSLYLSRQLETTIPGYEKISHVFQPRVVYARSLYDKVSNPSHPFFLVSGPVANPRFDINDQFSEFEYLRFELINRLRRKVGDSRERFLLLQISQQYNLRTFPGDPRFQKRLGPIEIFNDLTLWRFSLQLQATYDLEATLNSRGQGIHENNWSASLLYSYGSLDYIRLNTLLRNKADSSLSEQSLYLDLYKKLPIFFHVDAQAEYSMKGPGLLGYSLGLHFGVTDRSCWGLTLRTGRNSLKQPFVNLNFSLNFGNPGGAI